MTGRLRSKGQITIPKEITEAARLEEGDVFAFNVTEEGYIVLRPQKLIDASQAWFWAPAWQEGERRVSEHIEAGRVKTFNDPDDFFDSLPE